MPFLPAQKQCMCPPHSPDSSLSALQGSGGGTSQKRMVGQWPALKGRKISQTVFTLDPCAMRPAHVHQRADGLLYVISGKLLRHLVLWLSKKLSDQVHNWTGRPRG